MGISRWRPAHKGESIGMHFDESGPYVDYSFYEKLQAENAKLRDKLFQSEGGRIRQRSEIAKLKSKLEVAQKKREEKYTRWCCPQCFTSVRSTINLYKEKPEYKCPDHPNLDYVVIDKSLSALREKGV